MTRAILNTTVTILNTAATMFVLAMATAASAHETKLGDLVIDRAWARATPGAAMAGAAFMTLRNDGDRGDRLVGVAAGEVARKAELHTHIMAGGVMKMRRVDAIDVPAKGETTLAPGGFHVMLMGLKGPLEEGARFPLTLTFEHAGSVTATVVVKSVRHGGGMKHHGTKEEEDSGHKTDGGM